MQGLFQGWRRRCGLVTLIMAFVALGGWVRSLTIFDHLGYRITNGFYSLDSNLGTFMLRRSTTSATINANMLGLATPVTFSTVVIPPASGPVPAIVNPSVPTMTGVVLAVDSSTIPSSPVNAAVFVAGSPASADATDPSPVNLTDANIESEEPAEDSDQDSADEPTDLTDFTECVGSNFQIQPNPAGATMLVLNSAPAVSPFRWVSSGTVDQNHLLSGMPMVSDWTFCGIRSVLMRIDVTDENGSIRPLSETSALVIPYWIVAIPLILLSAYLLCSTPKLTPRPALQSNKTATSA